MEEVPGTIFLDCSHQGVYLVFLRKAIGPVRPVLKTSCPETAPTESHHQGNRKTFLVTCALPEMGAIGLNHCQATVSAAEEPEKAAE